MEQKKLKYEVTVTLLDDEPLHVTETVEAAHPFAALRRHSMVDAEMFTSLGLQNPHARAREHGWDYVVKEVAHV